VIPHNNIQYNETSRKDLVKAFVVKQTCIGRCTGNNETWSEQLCSLCQLVIVNISSVWLQAANTPDALANYSTYTAAEQSYSKHAQHWAEITAHLRYQFSRRKFETKYEYKHIPFSGHFPRKLVLVSYNIVSHSPTVTKVCTNNPVLY